MTIYAFNRQGKKERKKENFDALLKLHTTLIEAAKREKATTPQVELITIAFAIRKQIKMQIASKNGRQSKVTKTM
jgi:hypothetical protein